MPHFSESGNDTYLCQVCGRERDGVQYPSQWRPDLTGHKSAGNICPPCLAEKERPMSLYEHCKQESKLTDPEAIRRYMNRHYGHG